MAFTLHPRLAADTSPIADWTLSRVLLMNNKHFPWIVLVPRREDISELFQLEETARVRLMAETSRAAERLKIWSSARGNCDKINIGIIGNLVPQLHVHLIARSKGDSAWPGTVWGSSPVVPYSPAELSRTIEELRAAL